MADTGGRGKRKKWSPRYHSAEVCARSVGRDDDRQSCSVNVANRQQCQLPSSTNRFGFLQLLDLGVTGSDELGLMWHNASISARISFSLAFFPLRLLLWLALILESAKSLAHRSRGHTRLLL